MRLGLGAARVRRSTPRAGPRLAELVDAVGLLVRVRVRVRVRVGVGVGVGLRVRVEVRLRVGVGVRLRLRVEVGVRVRVEPRRLSRRCLTPQRASSLFMQSTCTPLTARSPGGLPARGGGAEASCHHDRRVENLLQQPAGAHASGHSLCSVAGTG